MKLAITQLSANVAILHSAPNHLTLHDALASASTRLASCRSPRLDAELLLMAVLGCDRTHLYAHPERILSSAEISAYESAVTRRASGVPVQYITGHQEFWGLDFLVTPAVLIPRPETEHLIEALLPLARSIAQPRIVDVGTGSGCIAIALAEELPMAKIDATDISPLALEIARANAAHHQVDSQIHFHQTDLLAGVENAAFDFVVSNPPYVGENEADQVQPEVRDFEPQNAVFAGPTGIEIIARLIPQANRALKPGGWLLMEISASIADNVKHLLEDWNELQITNDLQGISRVATARKAR